MSALTAPEVPVLGRVQSFLKQIVYGGNDGIVTTFAIVAGYAGAAADGAGKVGALAVLVFGLANLVADGVSMGMGEFLSTRSQRDLYRSRRAAGLARFRDRPEAARAEIAGLLAARGLAPDDAEAAARYLSRSPELAADIRLSYGEGLTDMRLARPLSEGLTTFAAFIVFGLLPLAPYLLLDAGHANALPLSVGATFGALLALGLLRWRAIGQGALTAVGETVGVGALCAAVAYLTGALVGG
ncbi:VIT1/CCC1 transporter family protein [Psychromarinibacter halotolerans]|uniref:VIT1/CCC1 transporter family protein n=1 Tax=Psychromarinibacter halotolerans TaxID=1775175 RepID=A0ABV7GPF4_9RHOB|nr:VIT1/CCC1 transporter family protein [Psychromarinibacter halotolerans]MDF0594557.1 VIT1/CCC1 transporter family protein [Psychromarinibacter halotolerans]